MKEIIERQVNSKDKLIKCERVNLKSCNLRFLPKDKVLDKKLHFSLSPGIYDHLLLSELKISIVNIFPENDKFAQVLSFSLVGVFISDENVKNEDLAEFGKYYSLSILWPYAREFSQDIFQRTGFSWDCLPIINPQDVTKKMIDNEEITVTFHD